MNAESGICFKTGLSWFFNPGSNDCLSSVVFEAGITCKVLEECGLNSIGGQDSAIDDLEVISCSKDVTQA